jgi:hypothetical protein
MARRKPVIVRAANYNGWTRNKATRQREPVTSNLVGRLPMKFLFVCATAFLATGLNAFAQSTVQSTVGSGGLLSLDRGIGQGKVELKCADSETTKSCVEAAMPILSQKGGFLGGGQTLVPFATTSLQCGSTIYQVSTGTNSGICGPTNGTGGTGVNCTDNKGNLLSDASCTAGCGTSTGSGSCTISVSK